MEVANIFDNGPISPIARIKDNLSIYTGRAWNHYQISELGGWPRSRPLRVDMVALSGATAIAANGQIAKRLVPILQVNDDDLLHIRLKPIDDVEILVYEQSGTAQFNSRGAQSSVCLATEDTDPWLSSTTQFIMGLQRDVNLEVQNPNPVALPQARLIVWGNRYGIKAIKPDLSKYDEAAQREITRLLSAGDKETVAKFIGPTTWLMAEGW